MTLQAIEKPGPADFRLEFLEDGNGIYGMSIPVQTYEGVAELTYILRPDRLDKESQGIGNRSNYVAGAALQTLPRRIFGRGHYIEHRLTVVPCPTWSSWPTLRSRVRVLRR